MIIINYVLHIYGREIILIASLVIFCYSCEYNCRGGFPCEIRGMQDTVFLSDSAWKNFPFRGYDTVSYQGSGGDTIIFPMNLKGLKSNGGDYGTYIFNQKDLHCGIGDVDERCFDALTVQGMEYYRRSAGYYHWAIKISLYKGSPVNFTQYTQISGKDLVTIFSSDPESIRITIANIDFFISIKYPDVYLFHDSITLNNVLYNNVYELFPKGGVGDFDKIYYCKDLRLIVAMYFTNGDIYHILSYN